MSVRLRSERVLWKHCRPNWGVSHPYPAHLLTAEVELCSHICLFAAAVTWLALSSVGVTAWRVSRQLRRLRDPGCLGCLRCLENGREVSGMLHFLIGPKKLKRFIDIDCLISVSPKEFIYFPGKSKKFGNEISCVVTKFALPPKSIHMEMSFLDSLTSTMQRSSQKN